MATYRDAVQWIADNDETAETDVEVLQGLASVCLVADVWKKSAAVVAATVIRQRARAERARREAR